MPSPMVCHWDPVAMGFAVLVELPVVKLSALAECTTWRMYISKSQLSSIPVTITKSNQEYTGQQKSLESSIVHRPNTYSCVIGEWRRRRRVLPRYDMHRPAMHLRLTADTSSKHSIKVCWVWSRSLGLLVAVMHICSLAVASQLRELCHLDCHVMVLDRCGYVDLFGCSAFAFRVGSASDLTCFCSAELVPRLRLCFVLCVSSWRGSRTGGQGSRRAEGRNGRKSGEGEMEGRRAGAGAGAGGQGTSLESTLGACFSNCHCVI